MSFKSSSPNPAAKVSFVSDAGANSNSNSSPSRNANLMKVPSKSSSTSKHQGHYLTHTSSSSASQFFASAAAKTSKLFLSAMTTSHQYHHHNVTATTTAAASPRDFKKLWRKAFFVVLFIVRTKFLYLGEKATKLTRLESDQIKDGFRSFIPQFGSITAPKVAEFFRFVGVTVSNEGGQKAALAVLTKAGKGDSDRMRKAELTLTNVLKLAQQFKRQFSETIVSEEELAFEAIKEWMEKKHEQLQLQQQQQHEQHHPQQVEVAAVTTATTTTAATTTSVVGSTPSTFYASSSPVAVAKNKKHEVKVTESDVHECLASFGVSPANFTEAAVRQHEQIQLQQLLQQRAARSQSILAAIANNNNNNNNNNTNNNGRNSNNNSNNNSNDKEKEDITPLPTKSANEGGSAGGSCDISFAGDPHTISGTGELGAHSTTSAAAMMMMRSSSTTHFRAVVEKPPPQPPSTSPLRLSTFREVFFQQKGPINKMQKLLAISVSNNNNSYYVHSNVTHPHQAPDESNIFDPSSLLASAGKDPTSPSARVAAAFASSITANKKSKKQQASESFSSTADSKKLQYKQDKKQLQTTKSFIDSLLSEGDDQSPASEGGGARSSNRNNSANINPHDPDFHVESEHERIYRTLKSIKVKMDLPSSLSLDADPIQASYDMRDWRESKEMQKMNAAKNRFDTEGDVGRGTGVRVLPTQIGVRIMSEAAAYKAQVSKANDDALLRAVEKNVKKATVDSAAIESKSTFRSYQRTKEENDAAIEYMAAKKQHHNNSLQRFGGSGASLSFQKNIKSGSLSPEPGKGSSSHLKVIRSLGGGGEQETNEGREVTDNERYDDDDDDQNLPFWLRRARKRRNFVPFMARPIPRSDLSRHLREALPRKSPSELCGSAAFALTTDQRMQLGHKMIQDQQELHRELMMMMKNTATTSEPQHEQVAYHGDARMAASVLLDVMEAKKRDDEMRQQQQEQEQQQHHGNKSQQSLLSAPHHPDWAAGGSAGGSSFSSLNQHLPRAGSAPL